jgi:hypothetical protein
MDTNTKNEQSAKDQMTYQTPEIIEHGSIESVTQGPPGPDVDFQGGSSAF